jgi:hypothetical protein
MLTIEKHNVILWEAESTIDNKVVSSNKDEVLDPIEQFMQEEPFYGDPDYSYY